MKKIFVVSLLCVFCFNLSAQNKEENNSTTKEKKKSKQLMEHLLVKDRVVLDMFSSYWLNFDDGTFSQRTLNQGVNFSILYDIPVSPKSPFSFGLGLGITNHNLYSNANYSIGTDYTTVREVVSEEYTINKISFTNINIPFEFRYFDPSGFKMSLGVRIGLLVDCHTKYHGQALDGTDQDIEIKNSKIPGLSKVPVEFTFRTGWKFIGINASYMVTKFFETDQGPQMYPFNVGISLSIY